MRAPLRSSIATLVCFAALGLMTACDGEVVTSTGSGGSDGGGDGQGGAGGLGASIAGGGAGDSTEECPPCGDDEVCTLGRCAPIEEILLTASQSTTMQLDGQISLGGVLTACERPLGEGPSSEVVLVQGNCRAVVIHPPPTGEAPQFGQVVASAPSIGSIELSPSEVSDACVQEKLGGNPDFLTGETVTFQVGAGTYTPDFQIAVASPPPLGISSGDTVIKGLPFEVSWDSGDVPPTILLFTLDGSHRIECKATKGTSLTIPGSLTAMLDSPLPAAFVGGLVRAAGPQVELSPGFRARAESVRTTFRALALEEQ